MAQDSSSASRHLYIAGLCIAVSGTLILAGWIAGLTSAQSILPGWRTMVPSSAFAFIWIGAALAVAGFDEFPRWARSLSVFVLASLGAVLPILTVTEYLLGSRTGLETWLGFSFDGQGPFAGRMSPMASVSLTAVSLAVAASGLPGSLPLRFSRVAAGATLLISWFAVLTLSIAPSLVSDVPRFPGMAVMTIVLLALSSAATLGLSLLTRPSTRPPHARLRWPFGVLLGAFLAPLLLGWGQTVVEQRGWVDPQFLTAVFIFGFALLVANAIWRYATRLSAVQLERERVLVELEDRVRERTHALASSNDELRKRDDELRDADRRKDEFLATLAHELRNPLAPIRNAASILRLDGSNTVQLRDAGAIIDRQVTVMRRLIDDLLDVSRITAGKLQIRKARVDIAEIIDLAVATNRPHIDQAGHRLTVSLPTEPVYIDGDAARLSQTFANLIHNACKYTEPGGEIAVTAQHVGHQVTVTVRDNGIGIPPEFLPRLFEKFSQVVPPLDRTQGGLGLGLSLVHGIVALHGGSVVASSEGVGKGSAFVVTLPESIAPDEPVAIEVPVAATAAVVRRVLVVDDNEDSAESLALLLGLHGHTVEVAHDGEMALAVAERFHPDAMLLDLGMPKLNGFEVCRRIRQSPWGATMMLIAQTGWGQEQDRRRSREAGFDWHLTKPVDLAQLQALLVAPRPPSSISPG